MEAIAKADVADITLITEPNPELSAEARKVAPQAEAAPALDEMLESELDGVVIATPSALHAEQSLKCLEHGLAVFCQKPLGRDAAETNAVISAARKADLLLGVDLSYRHVTCIREVHELCRQGELGDIYAVDLFFHNAYGPDKAWFYDPKLSGGGCVIDLGIHLVDLACWNLGFPPVTKVCSRLFAQGKPLHGRTSSVEDYAIATIEVESGATIRLACSWKLSAGCDAIVSGAFYGTKAGAAFHNIDGSFYHFSAERFQGTRRESLTCAPEQWGGRAAADWARCLAAGQRFDPKIEELNTVAETLDAIYENSSAAFAAF